MTDHELILEFSQLMSMLRNSAVERYMYFYNKGDNTCPRVQQSMKMFESKDKEKLISTIKELYNKLSILE